MPKICEHDALIEDMILCARAGISKRKDANGMYLCPDCNNRIALNLQQWKRIVNGLDLEMDESGA